MMDQEDLYDLIPEDNEMAAESLKAHVDNLLPTIESWYTINNNDFYFNFKTVATVESGLYSMIYNDHNGFGISKLSHKSDEFFHLPSLPHKEIIDDLKKFDSCKQAIVIPGDVGYLLAIKITDNYGLARYRGQ